MEITLDAFQSFTDEQILAWIFPFSQPLDTCLLHSGNSSHVSCRLSTFLIFVHVLYGASVVSHFVQLLEYRDSMIWGDQTIISLAST